MTETLSLKHEVMDGKCHCPRAEMYIEEETQIPMCHLCGGSNPKNVEKIKVKK